MASYNFNLPQKLTRNLIASSQKRTSPKSFFASFCVEICPQKTQTYTQNSFIDHKKTRNTPSASLKIWFWHLFIPHTFNSFAAKFINCTSISEIRPIPELARQLWDIRAHDYWINCFDASIPLVKTEALKGKFSEISGFYWLFSRGRLSSGLKWRGVKGIHFIIRERWTHQVLHVFRNAIICERKSQSSSRIEALTEPHLWRRVWFLSVVQLFLSFRKQQLANDKTRFNGW